MELLNENSISSFKKKRLNLLCDSRPFDKKEPLSILGRIEECVFPFTRFACLIESWRLYARPVIDDEALHRSLQSIKSCHPMCQLRAVGQSWIGIGLVAPSGE